MLVALAAADSVGAGRVAPLVWAAKASYQGQVSAYAAWAATANREQQYRTQGVCMAAQLQAGCSSESDLIAAAAAARLTVTMAFVRQGSDMGA